MAEAFLSQLLRVENSVQTGESQCCICLQDYGSLRSDSGTIECRIRLPCNHTVGSGCIAVWLSPTGSAKNSCPICRYIFFPAQPQPYLEHGIIEDEENELMNWGEIDFSNREDLPALAQNDDEEDVNEEELNLETVRLMCETYCYRLNLNLTPNSRVIDISQRIAERTYVGCQLAGHSPMASAAVSVYVASHLIGAPKSPHRVAMMSSIDPAAISGTYWLVYDEEFRAGLLNDEMLASIDRAIGRLFLDLCLFRGRFNEQEGGRKRQWLLLRFGSYMIRR